jgi:sugar lactone lactonase YvrE
MVARVELAVDSRDNLGESPVWEARSQRLYWIDINGKRLSAFEPATRAPPCRAVALPALVGTIVPRLEGGLLACLEEDIVPVNPDTGVVGLPLLSVPPAHRARARPRGAQRRRSEGLRRARRIFPAQPNARRRAASQTAQPRNVRPREAARLRGSVACRGRSAWRLTRPRRHPACAGGPGMRFNDGKCDRQGRLWVGTMHAQCAPAQCARARRSRPPLQLRTPRLRKRSRWRSRARCMRACVSRAR